MNKAVKKLGLFSKGALFPYHSFAKMTWSFREPGLLMKDPAKELYSYRLIFQNEHVAFAPYSFKHRTIVKESLHSNEFLTLQPEPYFYTTLF